MENAHVIRDTLGLSVRSARCLVRMNVIIGASVRQVNAFVTRTLLGRTAGGKGSAAVDTGISMKLLTLVAALKVSMV